MAEVELIEIDAELLKKEDQTPIKLAVQPEGGRRIIEEYSAQTMLSDILQDIETKGTIKTKRFPRKLLYN